MEKWIAVRTSAVVSIAGSVASLVFAAGLGAALTIMPPQGAGPFPPAALQAAEGLAALLFAGLGVWGVAAGIGIFRRREWARLSIVIFAAMAVFASATGLAAMLMIPQPDHPGVNARLAETVRHGIEAFYVALALLGVWWLALFNRASAKRYFAGGGAEASARPLSISAIAYYLMIGAAGTALSVALRAPAVFFGAVATGWTAMALYSAYTAVQVYLAAGLLQLDEKARVWAIVYFVAGAANTLVLIARPGFTERMFDLQVQLENAFNRDMATFPGGVGVAVAVSAVAAVPIWFLVRRRAAFTSGGRG